MEKWKTVFPVFQNGGLEKWKTKEQTDFAAVPANYTASGKTVFLRVQENGFPEVFQRLFRAVIPRIVVAREEGLEAESLKVFLQDWMMLSATSFAKFAAPSQVPIRSSASEGRSFDNAVSIFRRLAVDFLFFFQFCFFMPRYSVQNSSGRCP